MLKIDYLTRAVQRVWTQRQADGATAVHLSIEQGDIFFIYCTRKKLSLQVVVGFLGKCHHH